MSVLVGGLIKIVRSAVVAAVSLLIVGAIVAPSQAAMDTARRAMAVALPSPVDQLN